MIRIVERCDIACVPVKLAAARIISVKIESSMATMCPDPSVVADRFATMKIYDSETNGREAIESPDRYCAISSDFVDEQAM